MLDFLKDILLNNGDKRIAVVSHGAAIKFFLQHYCKYNYEENCFIFNNQKIYSAKLESPSVLELIFNEKKLISISEINFLNT